MQEQTVEEARGFSIEIVPHGPARQSEAGLLSLGIDSLPEPAIIFLIDGTILAANPGAAKLFECKPAELIGRNLYSNNAVDAGQAQTAVASLIRGDSIRFEIKFQTKTGNELILEIMNLPFLSPSGAVERVLAFARDITHQKKAEHEQALLSALVKSSDDAISSLSTDFRITSWNRGAQKLLGYTAEEVIGRLASEVYVPAEGRKFAQETMERDLSIIRRNPDAVRPVEIRVQRKDGAFREVAILACGIRDTAGKLIGISTIMRDITERRRIERDKAALAAIVESSDDAIVTVGPDQQITYWNKGAEKLFGFTAAEAIGSPLTLHIPPEEHCRAVEISNRIIQHPEEVVRLEVPNVRKDGTRLEVSMVVFAIRDNDGKGIATCAIARDVTERKKAEAEVAWLAAVVNASQDAIISVTPDSTIVTWNPAAEKVYGYMAEEAIGKRVDLFVPPEELERSLATTRRVSESGQSFSWEQTAFKKDGRPFVTEVNIFPIRDATGSVVRVTGIGRDITRLKNIEKELRETRDYNRGLIESSVDAMVVVNRDLHITDCNEQLANLAEVPKKVLIGSRFDGYFTRPAEAAAAIGKALAEGVVTNYDLVLRAASGKEILVSFNGSVFLRTGLVSGIFGVARDVTEQRAVQRRLADELNYSSSLVESSPDALLVTGSNLLFTQVNGQALRLTGYGRDDLIGVEAASIFTETDKTTQILRCSLEQGIVRDAELCLLTRTAESIPVSLCASAFRDKDGSVRGVILAVRNISERKRAEKEGALLASIVDASGDAIYSEAADLTITSWNAAAERLFGYIAVEIIGRNAAMLVPLEKRAEVLRQVSIEGREGQAERIETTRTRKGGRPIQVALTRAPIFDDEHKVVGFSVTAHDITERKRIQEELTAARDAALEAARAKAEFLANMSHEIRTPLNSVIGMTGLLLETQLTAEQHEYAHDVRESGEALLALINEILDFSKLAAGKMAFEEIDFELGSAVSSAIDLVGEQARRKDLELIVSLDPDVPRDLRGDPARLRQVLLNLLGNAIKFTARGEVALTVNKLSDNGKEAMLRFEVRDTGVGIAKNKLHLLFQPFSQVDASTTRLFGGTGLGLSIARQIVERMGGSISLSSTEGAGSTFWFTAKFRRSGIMVKPASECFASLGGRRLLIVDDNAKSLQILETQALAWKMDVETAVSADSALVLMGAAARARPFEAALVDVKMPEVDGIELARIMKSDPKYARTRILLISSVGPESEFHDRLQGIEIAGWLAKPISQSALYNALVRTLADSNAESETRAAAASETGTKALLSSDAARRIPGKKLRVLLAEDNPINQKLAKFQLRKIGADVDCAANGREALEAAKRLPYDAILMDCQMPEMDGYEATREIRRLEGADRHTPIIALTAHALSGDREACLAAGMDAYISKPVNIETLGNTLGKVAQRVPLSPVQAAQPAPQCSEEDPSTPAEATEKPKAPATIAA